MTLTLHATRWFVTPITKPDRHIDGPFETRDACERRCLQLASEDTKRSIIESLLETGDVNTITTLYMPSPSTQAVSVTPPVSPHTPAVSVAIYVPPSLLNKLKQLPRGKLMQIATAIKLSDADTLDHNKHSLAAIIFKALKNNATETPLS